MSDADWPPCSVCGRRAVTRTTDGEHRCHRHWDVDGGETDAE